MNTQKSLEVLEALVGFDTTSRNTNLPLIAWIEQYLDKLGVAHQRIPSPHEPKSNLWATIGPKDVPGFILSGHTDVVPVDGQEWSSDPFKLTRKNGRVYGRGSTDMKGFVACCLAAVPDMLKANLTQPFHLAFSYDEEVGCVGARDIAAHVGASTVKPIACFVGEPTKMEVVIGHKSKRSFRVAVRGRTCHSSLAPLGVNAVEYAARLVTKIREVSDRHAREGARDALYDIPFTTAHTGMLHGGTALNIVPDDCKFEFEFRSIAEDSLDALTDEVTDFARKLEPEMKAVAPEAGITIEPRSSFPGLETAPAAEVVTLAKRLTGRNAHSKVAYGTEAGLFHDAGVPTVVVGPGSIDQAHKADEFVEVSELDKCGAFLDRLIAHASR